jgi:alanine racemase
MTDPRNAPTAGEALPAEVADAVLTVDLAAIRSNYRLLSARAGGVECAGVVKADGYGVGASAVARALAAEGCRTFFVAHLSEGIALRAAIGDDFRIFILNGLSPGAEGACHDAGLMPMLNSIEQLHRWRALAASRKTSLPAAVQVDSGMSRLGMAPSEVDAVAADASAFEGIDLQLVTSHLACADEPDHPANRMQLGRFNALRQKLPAVPASLANSSGIFLGSDYCFDMVRAGAALYGVNPTPHAANPMRPAVRLEARVIQTRALPAGEGIGYGHAARTSKPTRTATISLGYADGWPRRATASAFFRGTELPFIGRVSMDSIVLDISALADGALRPGDMVELIGAHRDIDAAAALAGTIGYEMLTSLGSRFHRVFAGGDDGGGA